MPCTFLPGGLVRQWRMCVRPIHYEGTDWLTIRLVVDGRVCQKIGDSLTCCMPCPMTDWVYPESFRTLGLAAGWVAVVSTILCVFLLLSWTILPVEKTNRHYMSICLTIGVLFMNVSPLAHTLTASCVLLYLRPVTERIKAWVCHSTCRET